MRGRDIRIEDVIMTLRGEKYELFEKVLIRALLSDMESPLVVLC